MSGMTNGNLAYDSFQEEPWEELIAGKVVQMSPRPSVSHNDIAGNIFHLFKNYLRGKPCRPFGDGTDLYLTARERYVPDGMIVCDRSKIRRNGVHGAPDLVVEVLSPGTARRDRGHKKNAYERCGVREYWIVSPEGRFIEQYLLENQTFVLTRVCQWYPVWTLEDMESAERAEAEEQMTFRCGLFDDLEIRLEDIFGDLLF